MAKKVTPKAEPASGQLSVVNLKGTREYRDWIAAITKKTRIPAAGIVRLAIEEWAARNGHPAPPER